MNAGGSASLKDVWHQNLARSHNEPNRLLSFYRNQIYCAVGFSLGALIEENIC